MNEKQKRGWKRALDIIITVLTALLTSLTATSCRALIG